MSTAATPKSQPAASENVSLRLKAGGHWLHLNTAGKGPPLLLLHGLGGSCLDYEYLAPLLASKFLVLMPDLPGHGDSDKPDASYTMDWYVQILRALCLELGLKRCAVVGHSMGGQLALMLAAAEPSLVSRLALICPVGGQGANPGLFRLLDFLGTGGGERFWLPKAKIAKLYVRQLTPFYRQLEVQHLARRVHAQWSGPESRQLERAFIRSSRSMLAAPAWPLASGLQVPVYMIWGSKDRIVPPKWTKRLWSQLPASRRRRKVLDCGHLPIYTQYQILAPLLTEFLAPGVD